jgi:hypothetical protein
MSFSAEAPSTDPLLDVRTYAAELDAWLARRPACLRAVAAPIPAYAPRVRAMVELMAVLYDEAWSRYGWHAEVGR